MIGNLMQKKRLAQRLIVLGILLGCITPLMDAMPMRGVGRSSRTSGFGSHAMARPSRGLRSPYDRAQTRPSSVRSRNVRSTQETRAPRPNAAAGPNSIVTPFACEELAQVSKCVCQLKDIVTSGFDVLCSKIESLSFSGLDGLVTELEIIASILENLDVDVFISLIDIIEELGSDIDGLASQNDLIFSKACEIETVTESTNSIVQIIETVLDDTFSKVCTIESIVEDLSTQGGSSSDVIVSSIEEIQTVVDNIFSKACTIESIVEGLATESLADEILLKVCTIDSKVDVLQSSVENIDVSGSAIEAIDSLSDEILQKVCTIDSKVDVLQSTVENIDVTGSAIVAIDSLVDETLQKVCTIDSKVDLLATESIAEEILQKACTIDSKVDVLQSTVENIDVTGSAIVAIDSLVDETLQKVCTIDSKVDLLATESIAEEILQKACTIDSKVDALSTGGSSNADAVISVIDDLQSTSEEILQKVCTIESKVDIIDSKSSVIINDVEIVANLVIQVDNKVDRNFSKICTIDSKIDELAFDTSLLPIINETTMHIDCAVGSKTDLAATDTGVFSTLDGINDTDISVISWLKTIMRELRGL